MEGQVPGTLSLLECGRGNDVCNNGNAEGRPSSTCVASFLAVSDLVVWLERLKTKILASK